MTFEVAAEPAKITILDVGHGSCAVIQNGEAADIIDAGPKSSLLEFIAGEGIHTIESVLISHADQDHIEGLIGLLASGHVTVKRIRLNTDSAKDSKLWKDLLFALDCASTAGAIDFDVALTSSANGLFDRGEVAIEILAPSPFLAARGPGSTDRASRRIHTNTVSVVVRIAWRGRPVLLLAGDLDEVGLDDLIAHRPEFNAQILVFPHHGSPTAQSGIDSFVQALIDSVSPTLVVFSTGRTKTSPESLRATITAIRSARPEIRIACTQLARSCAPTLPLANPEHLAPVYSRGRTNRECCAGSLTIDLRDTLDLVPPYEAHFAFVSTAAPGAMCR